MLSTLCVPASRPMVRGYSIVRTRSWKLSSFGNVFSSRGFTRTSKFKFIWIYSYMTWWEFYQETVRDFISYVKLTHHVKFGRCNFSRLNNENLRMSEELCSCLFSEALLKQSEKVVLALLEETFLVGVFAKHLSSIARRLNCESEFFGL